MNKQPKALYVLNFVSMWEFFSYYGMRALLVLYMIQELKFSDEKAFFIYTIYITCAELGALAGGILADRFLGLRRAVMIGGWIIATGHILCAFSDLFFTSLAFIVLGTCLFRSNAAAWLGTFYEENDPRRDSGYTLYYAGINVGGFLAGILCTIVADAFGWHAGFGLAALGMLAGNGVLLLAKRILVEQKSKTCCLPKFAFRGLGVLLFFLVTFYAIEEQLGSSLVLFSERFLNRETIFGTVPSASLISLNPLTIIIMGPLLSRFIQKSPMQAMTKIAISFGLLAAAFGILYFSSLTASSVPLVYLALSIVLIGLAEIFIGPTVYSAASRLSPQAHAGALMGVVTVGYSLANLLSGAISQMMVIGPTASLEVYAAGFRVIASMALILAAVAVVLAKTQSKKAVL